jgi:hypothetical protein
MINAAILEARRWGAIGMLRLASRILRCAMMLHRTHRISHGGLLAILSGTRVLERLGAWLALGHRRKRAERGLRSNHTN